MAYGIGAGALTVALIGMAHAADPNTEVTSQLLAQEIFKELVEINTTESAGRVTTAAEAMARRFRAAGFAGDDIQIVGDNQRKMNLVVRLHGTGGARPILLLGHLDVVEANSINWATDPFHFVEKDGYFYGRGTQDMKDGDAILVATLIRLKKEGYDSQRDLILALTADEESGDSNGVKWLFANRLDLVDAEFALNHDGPGVTTVGGKPLFMEVDVGERVYADFEVTVLNRGGHSREPRADNAIYDMARGLERLSQYHFPFELNASTRSYFEHMTGVLPADQTATIRGVLRNPPDHAAIARLSDDPVDNALTHTTCVATRLNAGHANNALALNARAIVNCRIMPGHEPEDVRRVLIRVLGIPGAVVRYVDDSGRVFETAEQKHGFSPPVLRADVIAAATRAGNVLWPGIPVFAGMYVGTTDAVYANDAGLPVFAVSGDAWDADDHRMHAADERISVSAFFRGVDFYYLFIKALVGQP